MKAEKIYPETLLQLIIDVLKGSSKFSHIKGIQPFFMSYDGRYYYVYVKNLSSAYFPERPDTTRAQLPIKEEFNDIKESIYPFIFLGYDQFNDVLVCWNHHQAKKRLNEKKSVSFYSRTFFQEEVVMGEFLRKELKNGDAPILFKRKDLIQFFEKVDSFFQISSQENCSKEHQIELFENPCEKLLKITDPVLIERLKPLIASNHTLEAIKIVEQLYRDKYPNMRLKDWVQLIRNIASDLADVEKSRLIKLAREHGLDTN